LSRLYRSVFRPLREFHIYYTLWHGLYGVDEDTHAANFFAAEDGFGAWTAATTQGFDFLTQVILRPEPGYYVDSSDDEGNPMLSPTWKDEGIVEVGVGLGAWYDSKWDHASGYYWFEQQSRIGVHWDKMLALQTLTDASPRQLVGMETMADPREYALGYQDLYAEPLTLFLGRLTAGEVGQLAPVMSDDGRLHYPDTTQLNSTWPPSETQFEVLEPGAHWLLQYNAGLFGKALLQRGYDASFLRQSRLFLKGHGSEITPPDDIEEVSFTNPSTGETYVAWSYPGENNNVELGPAARLIQKGNRLKERCAESENPSSLACDNLKLFGQDIDAQYRMYQYFEGY